MAYVSYQVEQLVADGALALVLNAYRGPPAPVHIVQLPGVPLRAAAAFGDYAAMALARRLRTKHAAR